MAVLVKFEGNLLLNKQRADCYRLLASFFYPPQRDVLLKESVCQGLMKLLADVCPGADKYVEKMQEYLEASSDTKLTVEFAALFVGPFELKAPPYGSVYLEDGRRVMGETTLETLAMYQDCGLTVDVKEPPDHIAIELEFMHYLIIMELAALQSKDSTQVDLWRSRQALFLGRYLAPWAPDFCHRIRNCSQNEYYRALADCLLLFIDCEHERFE